MWSPFCYSVLTLHVVPVLLCSVLTLHVVPVLLYSLLTLHVVPVLLCRQLNLHVVLVKYFCVHIDCMISSAVIKVEFLHFLK